MGPREPKPRWSDETWAITGNATARVQRLSANYDRQQNAIEKYAVCPNCGSRGVVTTKDKDFVPTGAVSRDHHNLVAETKGASRGESQREAEASQRAKSEETVPKFTAWLGVHWRAVVATFFFIAPIGSLTSSDSESIYTHSAAVNILVGVLVFGGFWAVAAIAALSEMRRRKMTKDA